MELAGKSAVVTGGGNGIGRAICLALAQRGVNVAIADLEVDAARRVAGEVAALGAASIAVQVDVAQEADLERLADAAWTAFGSVDLLINNAGVMHESKPLWQTSGNDLAWCFAVNVGGVMNGIRAFVPRFIEAGSPAWIMNVGSEHSLGVPHLFGGLYTGTKHAVLGLSDVLRRELPEQIGVSVLCPGFAESSLWRATERRQQTFGGSQPANGAAGEVMKMGMPADQVAASAIAGIEAGAFFVISHGHVVDYANERWKEIRSACEVQAPRQEGDDQYKVDVVMRKLRNQD